MGKYVQVCDDKGTRMFDRGICIRLVSVERCGDCRFGCRSFVADVHLNLVLLLLLLLFCVLLF